MEFLCTLNWLWVLRCYKLTVMFFAYCKYFHVLLNLLGQMLYCAMKPNQV